MTHPDVPQVEPEISFGELRQRPWFIQALSGLVALFLFAMVALMSSDVVMRYGYNASIFGGFEIVGYLLGLLIFSGFPVVTYGQEHIAVGLLDHSFRGRAEWIRDVIVSIASSAAILFMSLAVLDEALLLQEEHQVGQVLDIEIAPIIFVMAGLGMIAFLLSLLVVRDTIKTGRSGQATDGSPEDG